MKRGFTLIEVLVTMAVISILAGILVPAVWKFWESQEVQTTKERLNALKLAMVGDRNQVQNGIRTSYGFVGDNGELPFANSSSSLSVLVNHPTSGYPHWNGPYLSGFDPAVFRKDAWGNNIDFRACLSDSRYLSGTLRSGGLNGVLDATYDSCESSSSANFCKGDDICVPLDLKEVAPTDTVKGNVTATFSGSPVKYKIFIERADDLTPSLVTGCLPTVGSLGTSPVFGIYSAKGVRLPIGNARIYGTLYSDLNCTTPVPGESPKYNLFISDGLSTMPYNLNLTY